jgi:asparagine synthase (glutamine-hydrolysing)
MCGIAGIFVSKSGRVDLSSIVERMQSAIRHRGPDDEGLFISRDKHCALAHTRLSILDLSSAGRQPMGLGGGMAGSMEQGEDGKAQRAKGEGLELHSETQKSGVGGQRSEVERQERYWITCNGEIYNFKELRQELAESTEQGPAQSFGGSASGRSMEQGAGNGDAEWQSETDTEVILRAYRRWGMDCLQKLRGMFAFAIWDEHDQKVVLARDSFGIKSLYYYSTDQVFAFASEVRALLASGLLSRKLSADGLDSYLQFGSVQDPLTIIDGVKSLLPGHCLVVKLGDGRLKTELFRYSSTFLNHTDDDVPASRPEAVKLLRSKLEDSVRAHLVSDVPVAAFLSGGIDSSAIVGLMSRVSNERLRTFTVSFEETEFSEGSYANLIARRFGTEHEDIRLSVKTLMSMLPEALAAMDQPTMDGINTYVVSKAVRDSGIKVALSGVGGDELFAGYPSFHRMRRLKRLSAIPKAVRNTVAQTGRSFFNGSVQQRKTWDFLAGGGDPLSVYTTSRQLFAPEEVHALMGHTLTSSLPPLTSGVPPPAPRSLLHASSASHFALSALPKTDIINEVSVLELTGYMANTLLRDTDQMSMAHALEVRVPFVDSEVMNYVMALPGEWKINGGRPKPLLVDALGDLLPEEIWKRRKMGFTIPFQRWLKSALQNQVESTFNDLSRFEEVGLDSRAVKQVWQSFCANPKNVPWSRPWSLYVLKNWCDLNGIKSDWFNASGF